MDRKIAKNQRKLIDIQNSILSKRRQLQSLRHQQGRQRDKRFAAARLQSWRSTFDIVKLPDGSLRPPDKTFNVRAYSNMDRDMWDGGARGEKLRGWFQKGAGPPRERTLWNAEGEGYLVQNAQRGPPTPDVYTHQYYESRILNRSPYTVPDQPAGFP